MEGKRRRRRWIWRWRSKSKSTVTPPSVAVCWESHSCWPPSSLWSLRHDFSDLSTCSSIVGIIVYCSMKNMSIHVSSSCPSTKLMARSMYHSTSVGFPARYCRRYRWWMTLNWWIILLSGGRHVCQKIKILYFWPLKKNYFSKKKSTLVVCILHEKNFSADVFEIRKLYS